MDGWNTTFLLGRPIFRGYVSFRESIFLVLPVLQECRLRQSCGLLPGRNQSDPMTSRTGGLDHVLDGGWMEHIHGELKIKPTQPP